VSSPAQPVATEVAPAGALRAFSVLNGLVLLGILLQGVWGGGLVGDVGSVDWRALHGATGSLTVLLALAGSVVALTRLRGRRELATRSALLFVLMIVQAGLGAGSDGSSGLLLVHVPLALVVMALGVHLSTAARRASRAGEATAPR
jgi:heme A synthase